MIFPIFFFLSARICVLFADLPRAAYEYEPEHEPQNIQFWKVLSQAHQREQQRMLPMARPGRRPPCIAGAPSAREKAPGLASLAQ
jgi:hypothetical protein